MRYTLLFRIMAQNSCNVSSGTKTGPSVDEFQRKLHRWFEDQGLLSDLRAHMRQLIIAALKGTQLAPQAGQSMHQNTSPKVQAINLLIAEFLLLQDCHYTLSVFTSEVPLLRNLPEFTPSFKDAAKNNLTTKTSGDVQASPSRLQERRVWDILEALGFSPDSSAGKAAFKLYAESNSEPLLTCLIRSVSKVVRHDRRKEKPVTEENISVSDSETFLLNTENSDTENKKMSVIHELLQKVNVKPKYMKRIENEIKRLIKATQLAEQESFHEKLLSYEKRIQEERAHCEKELYSQLMVAQQQLVGHGAALETGSRSLEAQVTAALEKLQQNLKLVEERDKRKEQEYLKKKMNKKESTLPKERKDVTDNKQQDVRHRGKSKKPAEKVATSVHQEECQQILEERSSCTIERETSEEQGQMTSSKSQLMSSVSSRDQSVQVGKPVWQLISDFEDIRATVQRLQQENEELQNLMRQQQIQVSELRMWGQLRLAPTVSRSPAQTHLAAPAETNAPVLPPPSSPPPPIPPRVPQQRVYYPPGDGELHFRATGATCVAPVSPQRHASGRPRTRRLRRYSTPRRVLHSSEETSPTEEMLRDARRRLRQLEEESEAVDRSYREFCLRQQRATPVSDVLAGLLHPPLKTESPLNNGPNASDATGDPSGLKLVTRFPPRADNFSSESVVAPVGGVEAEGSHITLETQSTTVQHITRPTVTLNSNICLSDLFYEIPSSEIISEQSVAAQNQGTLNTVVEKRTETYQTAKMEAQSEVHTTHIYKTPLLSSTIGNTSVNADKLSNSVTNEKVDSGCEYNKHKNKPLNTATIHPPKGGMTVPEENNMCFKKYHAHGAETANGSDPSSVKKVENKAALSVHQAKTTNETMHSNAKGTNRPELATPLDNTLKILKDSKETATERQRIGLDDENVLVKLYEQKPLKTLVITDLADKPHLVQTTETKSGANSKNECQKTTENGTTKLTEPQASPKHSFKGVELTRSHLSSFISRTRLSELALLQGSSEELHDDKVVSQQEKDSRKNNILHNVTDISSGRISLGEAEFIPACSGDQLFVPTCDSDTETEPEQDTGTSKSEMLSINDDQNRRNYESGEQAISNTSLSSEQPISAGKSVNSEGNDFW